MQELKLSSGSSAKAARGWIAARLSLVLFAVCLAAPAQTTAYLPAGKPDGIALLPPPPAPGSSEQAADLASVRAVFHGRTPAEEARAFKDASLAFELFAPAIGPAFDFARLPKTRALLQQVKTEISGIIDAPKDYWRRQRPYVADEQLSLGAPEPSFSYPSGHSTRGTVYAAILAEIFPREKEAIQAVGCTIGWDRVLIGKHFPTDVYAGRVLGRAIFNQLLASASFQSDLAAARAEARAAQGETPDLTGAVAGPSGEPITNASVFIYTAGPRLGPGILCPSCYADCRKSATSGAGGAFRIEALDTNLLFQVLVVAPGHVPTFFNKVDPLKGPLDAKLKPRLQTNLPSEQVILGRVVNGRKEPLAHAVVSVNGTTIGNTTFGRPPEGTDPLAVTDERGEFSLSSPGKFDAMNLRIEAQGFAPGTYAEVRPGVRRGEYVLGVGATLTGRVLWQGKPLKAVDIGVAGADRSVGQFTGDFVIKTMDDGNFLFANLPPNREYAVYGLMDSLSPYGALPVRTIRVKGDDTETQLGELALVKGYCVSGQVKLSDGEPVPPHTRVLLGRPTAWDTATAEVSAEGRFGFTNVPAETLTLDTRVRGYHLSQRNASLDRLNPFQLVGRLDRDKSDLLLLLEPGQNLAPEFSPQPEGERPGQLPLGGAETRRVVPGALTFSGQVVEAGTGAPLPHFRITPGLQRAPSLRQWIEWYRTREVEGTNGVFSLEMAVKTGAIVLMAEADGFLPGISEPLSAGQARTKIQLKRGVGPQGKVVLPDGTAADGVTVCYLVGREQAGLTPKGTITVVRDRDRSLSITDPEGDFSFAPKLGEGEVFAAGAAGFARCRTSELAAKGKMVLQPWGGVRGRLVQNSKPVAGENLDLGWPGASGPDRPWFNLHGTRTDESGRFTLEQVPPGEIQITTRVPVGAGRGSGWTSQPQRKFSVKPGQDLDLGDVEKSAAAKPSR